MSSSIIEFIKDITNRKSIIYILLVIFFVCIPITESVSLWKETPYTIFCYQDSNSCKLVKYAYEHKICWDSILTSRHTHRLCRLPTQIVSETKIFDLTEISDVTIKQNAKIFSIYIKNKEKQTILLTEYKNEDEAKYIASQLRAHIKHWQAIPIVDNYYMDNDNGRTFEYSFSK